MSETPSNTRESRKRRDGCCLLLDENICTPIIAEPLRRLAQWKIEIHRDHLPAGAPDPEVVTYCGERGWGLITCDDMRHCPDTVRAIIKYQVGVFRVILRKEMHGVRIMSSLVQAQPAVIKQFHHNRAAFWSHILSDGDTRVVSRFDEALAGLTESQRKTFARYGRI